MERVDMTLSRQQTSLTCTFCFLKLDHVGVFGLCQWVCMHAFWNITSSEWRKQNVQAAAMFLDWVSCNCGVNTTYRIAAILK